MSIYTHRDPGSRGIFRWPKATARLRWRADLGAVGGGHGLIPSWRNINPRSAAAHGRVRKTWRMFNQSMACVEFGKLKPTRIRMSRGSGGSSTLSPPLPLPIFVLLDCRCKMFLCVRLCRETKPKTQQWARWKVSFELVAQGSSWHVLCPYFLDLPISSSWPLILSVANHGNGRVSHHLFLPQVARWKSRELQPIATRFKRPAVNCRRKRIPKLVAAPKAAWMASTVAVGVVLRCGANRGNI